MARSKGSKVTVKDLGWKKSKERLIALGKPFVTVGVHQEDIERTDSDGTSAPIAAIVASVHEFGSDDEHIPPRPYLRSTMDSRREDIVKVMERAEKRVSEGTMTPFEALSMVGQWVQAAVQKTITDLDAPALSEATKKSRRNGGENPLVDTGQLRSSIRYQVHTGEKPEEDK